MLHLPQTRSFAPMLVPSCRACKHNCTRPSGIYVTVVPDKQPCLFKLNTISIHVCYSFILSASVNITFAPDPCLNDCIRQFAMSFTVAPNQQSCLLNLRLQACMSDTLAHEKHSYLYSNIQPSVLPVALALDQFCSNFCYNCTGPAGLYFKVTPNRRSRW